MILPLALVGKAILGFLAALVLLGVVIGLILGRSK